MKSLAPNTLLQNRYLIVHLIGKGGMGDVYLAVDQRLGSAVALKRTFFSDDEMLGNAFEREAKTLARLRHAVLPKVSDHFVENDQQFLVMEHISGDDLSKRLELAQKPFPISWVLFWADQLLDALAYLHGHEPPILHRDIKPQNLKLTDENSIILLDFGLSKNTVGETRPVSGGGSTGSVVGYTPHYAPMEQIRGTGTNPRSDLYALSATLYQLLTSIVPPDALTRADALINGLDDPVIPINELNPEIPHTVSSVILKGMEISQDKRFATAREMQKELREAYAQIQNAMFANTVAFNLQNEQETPANQPLPPSLEKTEVLNLESLKGVPSVAQSVQNYSSQPQQAPNLPGENGNSQNPTYDATLRMDSFSGKSAPADSADSQPKQSNLKTEVFLVDSNSLPSPGDFTATDKAAENSKSDESFSVGKSYDYSQPKSDAKNIESAAGSLFSPDKRENFASEIPDQTDFYTNVNVEQSGDAFSTFTPTRSYAQEDFAEDFSREDYQSERYDAADSVAEAPQPTASPAQKSSNKMFVVGGLLALLVLVIGAASGGWLLYKNYSAASVSEKVEPTPQPTAEFSPTPQPTIETAYETNSNSSSDNSANEANTEIVSSNASEQANSNTSVSGNATAVGQPKTNRPPPQVSSTQKQTQVAVKNTPKTNQTQAPKEPTKPAEKKPTAPVILQ